MPSNPFIEKIGRMLQKAGYEVANHLAPRSCFDIAARKEESLLLLKVLANVDGVKDEQGRELRLLAKLLSATPLIVGERTRKSEILDGVVYGRCGIPTINISTLKRFIFEDVYPVVLAKRGGLYLKINGEALRRAREERGFSLGNLAERVGVSRKAIYEYERNMMDVTLETAVRIEEELDADVIMPIDFTSWESIYGFEEEKLPTLQECEDELEGEICKALSELGFKVIIAKKAPFNALTADQKEEYIVVTGVGRAHEKTVERRIKTLERVSRVVRKWAMFVLDKERDVREARVPVLSKEEIESMEEPEDLLKKIQAVN
ncbi:MAG: transcriptional regulator [Candidatus Freyarchaeota archaeon]